MPTINYQNFFGNMCNRDSSVSRREAWPLDPESIRDISYNRKCGGSSDVRLDF